MCFRHTQATSLQSLELGLGSHVQNLEIEESKGKYSLQSEVILPTTTSSSPLGGPSGAHPRGSSYLVSSALSCST